MRRVHDEHHAVDIERLAYRDGLLEERQPHLHVICIALRPSPIEPTHGQMVVRWGGKEGDALGLGGGD